VEGAVVAGRYRVGELLGRGAQGEVWRARDRLLDVDVAIKLVELREEERVRARREVSALRVLRVPGVVRLFDEGIHEGRAFFATELVEGDAFPGCAVPCDWPALEPLLLSLLETLTRVHAAGVLHLDLKPLNVLVANGRPVLVDFGLARFNVESTRDGGALFGTPAYLAPEQIRGGAVSAASDLYAVGVMAFEALTGRLPHDASDRRTLMRARLSTDAPPIASLAEVPTPIALAIDSLLARDPSSRPRSAAHAVRELSGSARPRPELQWIGARADVERICDVLARGGRAIVSGPRGSGKTRLCAEVRRTLKASHVDVRALAPSAEPFQSLEPVIGPCADSQDSLTLVRARVRAAVDAFLKSGRAILVDPSEAIDRESAAILEESAGAILIATEQDDPRALTKLEPWRATDLEDLFVGPDRLFHLKKDAATILLARTGGRASSIANELEAWARAGLARAEGARFSVVRESLDALEASTPITWSTSGPHPALALRAPLRDLAIWIALAGPSATIALLARLTERAPWQIEAYVDELASHEIARRDGERVYLSSPLDASAVWGKSELAGARRSLILALPPGSDGRLWHLLADDEASAGATAREALDAAAIAYRAGRIGHAALLLHEGLRALATERDAESEALRDETFALWLELAVLDLSPHSADRLLYEIDRAPPTRVSAQIAQIARGIPELSSDPRRALDRFAEISDLAPRFEAHRSAIRMVAARSLEAEREAEVLAQVEAWARADGRPDTLARLDGWRGRYAYRAGDYEQAAQLHLRAAAHLEHPLDSLAARLHAGAALLEAFELDRAHAVASEAIGALDSVRNAHLEGRAQWILRTCRYRRGEDLEPDVELLDAAALVGVATLEGQIAITEAAFAWRAGKLELARTLALRAERTWRSLALLREFGAVVRSLAIVCGHPGGEPQALELVREVSSCKTMGASIQVAGLLSMAFPALATSLRERADAWSKTVPSEYWSTRIDVISVDEARSAIFGASRRTSEGHSDPRSLQ
jgi:eukaryotic-like serine/threonine-protein kinase